MHRSALSAKFVKENIRENLDVKWTNSLPLSMIIQSSKYCILEPYDFGRLDDSTEPCIGKNAPVQIIRGDSEYNQSLMSGFDYIFDQAPMEDNDNKKITFDRESSEVKNYLVSTVQETISSYKQ